MQYIKQLEKLLITKGQAGIPGLGNFILKDIPSKISDGKLIPPSKILEFESNLIESGEELIKEFATNEKLSETEAKELISREVNNMMNLLREGKSIEIQGIGQLKLEVGNIVLVPKISEVLNSGSFGLPDVEPILELDHEVPIIVVEIPEIKPELKSEPKVEVKVEPKIEMKETKSPVNMIPNQPTPTPINPVQSKPIPPYIPPVPPSNKVSHNSGGSKKWIFITIIVLVLVAIGYLAYKYKLIDQLKSHFKSNPKREILVPVEAPDSLGIDTLNEKRNALLYDESGEKKPLTYYIIAGSFKTKNRADIYSTQMTQEGFTTYTLNYGDTLFRVAIYASQNRQQVVDEFIVLQNEKGMDIWLLSL